MSISRLQTATPVAFSANLGPSISYVSAVQPGSLLVLYLASNNSAAPTLITEGAETVNTAVTYAGNASLSSWQSIYYVTNTAGGTLSFSVTFGQTRNGVLFAEEWAGIATSSAFDVASVVGTGDSTSPASASVTPGATGELALALLVAGSAGTLSSWSNGFGAQNSNTSGPNYYSASQILASTSGIASGATIASSVNWATSVALFKPAASPPPSNPAMGSAALLLLG